MAALLYNPTKESSSLSIITVAPASSSAFFVFSLMDNVSVASI